MLNGMIGWMICRIECKILGKMNLKTPKYLNRSGCLSVIYRSMTLMVLPEHPRITPTSKSLCFKTFLARLFVMSLNMYISLIGAMMYYLFKQSMAYREASEFPLVAMFDFKEIKFNRCECKPETTESHCYNVKYNFQNFIDFLPNEAFFLSLFIVPLLMHLLQAALLHLSPPVPMLNFVLGSKYEHEIQESEDIINNEIQEIEAIDEIEMEPMNATNQESNTNPGDENLHQESESSDEELESRNNQSGSGQPSNNETFSKTHWTSLVFGTLILLGIILLPFGFSALFDKAKDKDGKV